MFEYDNYDSASTNLLDLIKSHNIKLLRDTVIVDPIDDMTERGFIITNKHEDNDVTTTCCRGKVVLVGKGKKTSQGFIIEPGVKVGDIVVLSRARLMREKAVDQYIYVTRDDDILYVEDEE